MRRLEIKRYNKQEKHYVKDGVKTIALGWSEVE